MQQLVNFSNYSSDVGLIDQNPEVLRMFLNHHHLDGMEMLLYGLWDHRLHRKEWVRGVHLRFWPCWLDFWRQNQQALLAEFGDMDGVKEYYGSDTPEGWLRCYGENFKQVKEVGAEYAVFHVSQATTAELFSGQFRYSDKEVIQATVEVVNELTKHLPPQVLLLFENLWWPGLRLLDQESTGMLLEGVRHPKVGIMLDTGHLMNTNPHLRNEEEGVEYILQVLEKLGPYRRYIQGMHLHCSLSGDYVKAHQGKAPKEVTMTEIMKHVLEIDQHRPFQTKAARQLVQAVQPEYLVHEFMQGSLEDWWEKVYQQQEALGLRYISKVG